MGMVKMKHVNLYGPKKSPRAVLEILAREACFQPDAVAKSVNEIHGSAENVFEPLLTQTLGVLADLGATTALTAWDHTPHKFAEIKQAVEGFAAKIAQQSLQKTQAEATLATYRQTKIQLYHLTNLKTSIDEIFSVKYLKVRFGRLPEDSYIKLPFYSDKPFTFTQYDFDGKYYWGMYFVPETAAQEVDDIFASLYFERMWVPDFVHGTPQDAIAQIVAQETELEAQLATLASADCLASASDIEFLHKAAAWLNYEAQLFDMQANVITLEQSYYISGYVPQTELPRLMNALEALPDVKAAVDDTDLLPANETAVHPPVKLKNGWFARPFEMFIDMYGLPGYGEFDPTLFVGIVYALLFGVMFGDVGQGIVLALICYFIMYKKMGMQIGLIISRCSIFSVLFGFVYGSVFGFEHALDPMFHALGFHEKPIEALSRDGIMKILVISLALGIGITCIAMLINICTGFAAKKYAKSVFHVNGVCGLVMYLSLILTLLKLALGLAIPFVGTLPFYLICIALPFLGIYFSEPLVAICSKEAIHETVGEILMNGFFEMFDALLSYVSNTMSFLRVGGFVMAHAGMMIVVFTLANLSTNPVVYVLVVAIGNLFVMALEALFVGIQVLRLQFYEIFSRFYEASGTPFTPMSVSLNRQAE